MKFSALGLLIFSCLTLSCQQERKEDTNKVVDILRSHRPLEMTKVGESTVILGNTYNYDNFSGLTNQSFDGESRVIHLSNGQIFDFDPVSGDVNNFYEIPSKGPKKIKPQSDFDGIAAFGDKSYIYLANFQNKLLLVTPDGVKTLLSLKSEKNTNLVSSTQNRPESIPGGEFLFGLSPDPTEDITERSAFIKVGVSGESEFVITYPEDYAHSFYSTTPYLYWASVQYSSKKEEYLVSFPVSDYIYVYDSFFKLKGKYPAATSLFNQVDRFSEPVQPGEYPEPEKEDQYFRELSYYYSLYIDDTNEYIYRQVKKRNPNSFFGYDYFLMVLDFEYKVLGEWKIPSHLRPFNMFCNQNGLNIYDVGALGTTEAGVATFSIYKPYLAE